MPHNYFKFITTMIDRRSFLKSMSLLTLGGLASQQMRAAEAMPAANAINEANAMMAGKKMGLQTYSLGQELLKDLPNGLSQRKNIRSWPMTLA